MKKILLFFVMLCALSFGLSPVLAGERELLKMEFDQVEKLARGGEVRWYMYGGWAHVNDWVDTYVAGEMKKRYNIKLVRVPMDAGVFVNKLLHEKAGGKNTGTIDLLWINGENFKNAKEAGLLFGPFSEQLPNVKSYVDPDGVSHEIGRAHV